MSKIYAKPEIEAVEFAPMTAIAADESTIPAATAGGILDLSAGLEFSIDLSGNDEF